MASGVLGELGANVPPRVLLELSTPVAPPLPHVPVLLAGAAEVDITPPPGMPKAGHSSNAHLGTGFRTRLRAHVIHLRAGTTSLALVQCDLLAGSAIVQRLVAEAVADTDLPLAGLFMGATHTHAGPGQFHGNELMNRFSSNRRGFDPAWTDFLVARIADAVRRAVETRRPARAAFGVTEVWGLTRNRSLAAHLRNDNVRDRSTGAERKYAAVNPELHLLRVDAQATDGGFEPLAAGVIFSVHGTGISSHDRSYNADVWAYLKGELAAHITRSTGARAVVGAMEGTHGDVAPAVRPHVLAYPEAERVGRGIGAEAAALYDRLEAELSADVPLAAGLREVDLRAAPTYAGITLPAPAFGAATMAGAFENTTPVIAHLPPCRPGVPKPARWAEGPHGAKWIPFGRRIHDLVAPPEAFPSVLPVHVLRIGTVVVLGLPFEITVESGRRIAAAAAAASATLGAEGRVDRVAVSSLANEQFCYLTTPEEYALQRYEGGNTLYGPRSQPFVTALAADTVRDVLAAGSVQEHVTDRVFDFAARCYLARPTGNRALRTAGPVTYADPTATEDGYWQFDWLDAAPGDLAWHEPLVRIETRVADGRWVPATGADGPVDDQRWALGVTHLGAGPGTSARYAARWYTPYVGPGASFRFAIAGRDRPDGPWDLVSTALR
jgi:neutral ceramidase